MTNPIFSGLNPRQLEAVKILSGPALILAGAGSGKTKCLTHRIANLIANGTPGNEILAVSFTNKAANEMKTRVENLLEKISEIGSFRMPTMGTFHSVCVRILREDIEILEDGFSRNFVIFDSSDSQNLIKLCLKEGNFDTKTIKHRAVLSRISAAKNQLQNIDDFLKNRESYENEFSRATQILAKMYQKKLREHNALDFDDLIGKCVKLFEEHPEVLEKYHRRWQHFCIDEYQDTNPAQYRWIRLLADATRNLCVIGDDHQSIYRFRGADFTNILNFEADFPGAKVVKLEQNYRSTGNILLNANALISKNQTGRRKNLWTENEPGEAIKITEVENERDESDKIAATIRDHRDAGGKFSDIAILYRMNAQSRAIEEALMRAQIPYQIVGGTRFFDRKEIKDLIAYLRLIFNPRDDVSFLRIVNTPTRKIGASTLEIIKKYAKNRELGLFEVLEFAEKIPELSTSKKKVFFEFRATISNLQTLATTEPISILLDRLIDKIGFLKFLDDGTIEGESRVQNVRELFSVAGKYDTADDSLAVFLEGVSLVADVDRMDEKSDAVMLMTVHSAKGLEFPIVFLPGWEDGIFPGSSAQFSVDDLEEERRLGYVAITRAQKKCEIFHAKKRMIFGKTEFSAPSKFLSELDEEAVERTSESCSFLRNRERFSNENHSHFQPKTRSGAIFGVKTENSSGFSIGEKINHAEFGIGIVIQIAGDLLTVAFDGSGIKKIVASIAPIEKI